MTESAPSTRPTWTDEQALALHAIRAAFRQSKIPFGDAQSAAERAVIPSNLPEGLFITSTMVPPSLDIPASILQNPVVHPAETPLFFYTTSAEPPSLGGMPARGTKVIFFVHGGGNVIGHPTGQGTLPFLSDLVRKLVAGISARALIAAPSFRLATVPENCFPAALQDLYSAYSYLIKEGYDAKDVTIAGESGGGNLALILTYLISQSSPHALPDHVVTIAPAADLTHTLSDFAKAQADADLLSIASYEAASSQYLAAFPANDPLASSTFINFPPSWPKTLIMVGTADQLIDASRTIAKKIEEAGNTVKLIEFDDLPHGWWLFPSIFNQINDAIDKIVQFVQS
ncbi:alpha beta-hydrolase [Hygrophoropsis aurantiaca]|uniref:Alpha beta-hydrolase n=1 Tax=Hygrophoropsis aurantiaca TaxID=72124 RepID=A0ACB8AN50_9AGAM|nr:alpha beta-hydrolase [Hygrophoropsis aurantiaca]